MPVKKSYLLQMTVDEQILIKQIMFTDFALRNKESGKSMKVSSMKQWLFMLIHERGLIVLKDEVSNRTALGKRLLRAMEENSKMRKVKAKKIKVEANDEGETSY